MPDMGTRPVPLRKKMRWSYCLNSSAVQINARGKENDVTTGKFVDDLKYIV